MNELPIDDDRLLQEMTACLGTLYFPEKTDDDTIHELATNEFRRVKRIICRQYNFDEDRYISENCGVSPFDFVCDDIESEVYKRIRYDGRLLQLTRIREEAMRLIRQAVENEDNILGTFYRNKGEHYRHDSSAEEYDTSPIVITHNAEFCSYGGYEAATLYELFIDEDNRLLCTLNGESGEDFDEPIEHLQTEGLIDITHWLEEQGFITQEDRDKDIVVCDECGSLDVQQQAWSDPNTLIYVGETAMDRDDNWCNECEEHNDFRSLPEFKERMQQWWQETDFETMERMTGYLQADYPADEGHQAFIDACNTWWNKRCYDEQRRIWKENN